MIQETCQIAHGATVIICFLWRGGTALCFRLSFQVQSLTWIQMLQTISQLSLISRMAIIPRESIRLDLRARSTKPTNLHLPCVALFNPRYLGTQTEKKEKEKTCSCTIAWERVPTSHSSAVFSYNCCFAAWLPRSLLLHSGRSLVHTTHFPRAFSLPVISSYSLALGS